MTTPTPPAPLDARGPQFNAALTSVLLALVLVFADTPLGTTLLAVQAALFASGVALGVRRTPAAYLFRHVVRPHLGPPTRLEDPRPPRFAQGIGLAFTALGLVGFLAGPAWLGHAAVGMALAAALLNATVQLCLGCRLYGVCHLPQRNYQHDHQNTSSSPESPNKKEALV